MIEGIICCVTRSRCASEGVQRDGFEPARGLSFRHSRPYHGAPYDLVVWQAAGIIKIAQRRYKRLARRRLRMRIRDSERRQEFLALRNAHA